MYPDTPCLPARRGACKDGVISRCAISHLQKRRMPRKTMTAPTDDPPATYRHIAIVSKKCAER